MRRVAGYSIVHAMQPTGHAVLNTEDGGLCQEALSFLLVHGDSWVKIIARLAGQVVHRASGDAPLESQVSLRSPRGQQLQWWDSRLQPGMHMRRTTLATRSSDAGMPGFWQGQAF